MSTTSGSTVLGSGSFLRLVRASTWEYAERVNASGVVAIAALTAHKELVLVEQFRAALQRRVIELPAGLVGDEPGQKHEEFATAARRELEEETGFRAAHLRWVLRGPSSAGLSNEMIDFFIATGLERCGEGGGVPGEDITVHRIPLTDLNTWLHDRSDAGLLIDPKIFTGLYLLLHEF